MINQAERAYRAWPVLTQLGKQHSQMTYGELAAHLGVHHRAIRYILSQIQDYCFNEELQPLTILVINSNTGLPGVGFIACEMDDLERGRNEAYSFDWESLYKPFAYAADGTTEEGLIGFLENDPKLASEVFGLIKVRGMAQVIFRKLLLRIYGGQCAFCGLTFEDALQAAHLVRWSEASGQQRLDPRNGLLLCSNHHSLFDAGLLTIMDSGIIAYYDPNFERGPYSPADKVLTAKLHGKQAKLPQSELHRPASWAIMHHHKVHKWEI